jgi:hypothetical protein
VIQPHLGQDFETRKPRVPVTELKDVYYLPLSPGAKKIIVSFSLPLFDYFFQKITSNFTATLFAEQRAVHLFRQSLSIISKSS